MPGEGSGEERRGLSRLREEIFPSHLTILHPRMELWGMPLFILLFSVTFVLLVFLNSIFEEGGGHFLPYAGVFVFLSAIFWIVDPILKETLPRHAANITLIAIYLLAAQVLMIFTGGAASPFFYAYFLVVFTGAMAYGLSGTLIVFVVISLAFISFYEEETDLIFILPKLIVLFILGLMVGFLSETKRRIERRIFVQQSRIEVLTEAGKILRATLDPDEILETGLEVAEGLLHPDGCVFIEKDGADPVASRGGGEIPRIEGDLPPEEPVRGTGEENDYIACRVGEDLAFMIWKRRGRGLLSRPAFDDDTVRTFALLAEQIRISRRQAALHAKVVQVRDHRERILSAIETAVVSTDLSGGIVTVNKRARAIMGGEMIGKKWPGPDPASAGGAGTGLIEPGPGVEIPIRYTVTEYMDVGGRHAGWIIAFEDLRRVRELEERTRRAETMAALGEMSARIAHEIRNPLGGMEGFLTLAEREAGEREPIRGYIEKVLVSTRRLNRMVSRLLDLATKRPRRIEEVELAPLVGEVMDDLSHDESMTARIESRIPAGTVIRADRAGLVEILMNLIKNAAEAGENVEVLISESRRGRTISIVDDGPGAGEGEEERIFDPFYTTKEEGVGLGLSIARQAAEDLGMRLGYSRADGRTRFDLYLPEER